ncbi:IS30 family transposase (plasmid) [Rhizobium sp. CCGE 510]|nr:IS30 family transposase [Rhizobium sp. CCGE 510]
MEDRDKRAVFSSDAGWSSPHATGISSEQVPTGRLQSATTTGINAELADTAGHANVTSLVERKSRYTVLIKNPSRHSRPFIDKIIKAFLLCRPSRVKASPTSVAICFSRVAFEPLMKAVIKGNFVGEAFEHAASHDAAPIDMVLGTRAQTCRQHAASTTPTAVEGVEALKRHLSCRHVLQCSIHVVR